MPHNPDGTKFCRSCGSKLLLKDRYYAIKPLGQGGFGRTFLAVDEDKPSKPRCVIKQFFPQAQGTSNVQKAAELFQQEAKRLDDLGQHPQIPDLLAHFDQDGRQYLVQEFIEGFTLAQELAAKGAFNETQIRQLLNDLLPLLEFVHDHEVIHRDIKPDNIIRRATPSPPLQRGPVVEGQLVLVDFGAAKVVTAAALHQTGTAIGSPEYVAPEQARGRAVFASDIYSLGVTCVHLLTRMSPFDLYDIREDVWAWRQHLKHPISDGLGRILDKMLETATNRRYQSAAEVLRDLQPQTTPPMAAAKPPSPAVKSSPVTPSAAASKGLIEKELADVCSQFLGAVPSKSPNQASTPPEISVS
jgi:serine/threonine protein kinase